MWKDIDHAQSSNIFLFSAFGGFGLNCLGLLALSNAINESTNQPNQPEAMGCAMNKNVAVIILAAGLGTRMKSEKAKVLHKIQGRPMVLYVVEAARKVAGDNVVVVVGHQAETVRRIVTETAPLMFAYQENQLGTGHAVLCALPHIPDNCDPVVILCGDVPLIESATIQRLVEDHLASERDISVLAVELENPYGYGRILLDENRRFCGIVEEADATGRQKQVKLINSGIYCVGKDLLMSALSDIGCDNAQGELYLTDIIAVGYRKKRTMGVFIDADSRQVLGVNTLQDLETVDAIMENRRRIIP